MNRLTLILIAFLMSELTYAEIPTVLTDKIRKGVGIIDLLQDTTVTELQEYLANGSLYLGVDVNEEASGNESATSGGIAIAEMELIIATTEGSFSFLEFYTNTTAMIISAGAEVAQEYNTLFGSTGSNELTSSSGFDLSTLDDVIQLDNITISGEIISAELYVTFVVTDNSGVNEQFFDFSAGFEEFALLSGSAANLLDSANVGINEFTPIEISYQLSAPVGTPEPYWYLFLVIIAIRIILERINPSTDNTHV